MIRVGVISYLNTLPVYYAIDKGIVEIPGNVHVVRDVPSVLNRKLAAGELDVSVVSSFEYARHWRDYVILPRLSIAADGEVKSVLFLSRLPMEELSGRDVYLTRASLTSKNLLLYLFKKLGVTPNYMEFAMENGLPKNGYFGILLIGDDALKVAKRGEFPYVYDLANLWKTFFNMPFVFALWCVRKDALERDPEGVERLWRTLMESKRASAMMFEEIALEKSEELGLSPEECLEYLRVLHFDLDPEFIEGMKRYFSEMHKDGLLDELPEINIASYQE